MTGNQRRMPGNWCEVRRMVRSIHRQANSFSSSAAPDARLNGREYMNWVTSFTLEKIRINSQPNRERKK